MAGPRLKACFRSLNGLVAPTGLLALLLAAWLPAHAQTLGGKIYLDLDGDGVRDPGEPALPGLSVSLSGQQSAGGAFDQTVGTDPNGGFLFSPGDGCYVVSPSDPSGWRLGRTRSDGFPPATPGYLFPVGETRLGKLDQGIANLDSGSFRFTSMGDSIAFNFSICNPGNSFWYSQQLLGRLACASPSTTFMFDAAAVKGEHTDDLLVDDMDDLNNVFRVIEIQPDLIALSMIGNDLLGVDAGNSPTQEETNKAVAEVLDARQNLQEALSVFASEIPGADIVLNTLYDNEAYNCATGNSSDFHRVWIPIVDRILRDLAWGQARRMTINEVAAEFAHEDQIGGCTGFTGMICRDFFGLDNIHPNNNGYTIIREKIWEAAGAVVLGAGDTQSRTARADLDFGYVKRVRRLSPTAWEVRDGASALAPESALDGQDGGAPAVITLGAGTEELRLTGFPGWYDEVQIVSVVAGVRYRTTGTVNDDFYRMEASVTGQFRPSPGFSYGPTSWNFYTPLVGGGGPNQPPENADYPTARVLALPDVASYRDVSALLSKNPTLAPGAAEYEWPAITHPELATTAIRVVSAPVAGTPGDDGYQIELDHAWLDLYGWEKPRPPEVVGIKVDRPGDGSLEVSFDEVPGAQRYNLYFGRPETLPGGAYDHGAGAPAGPLCDAATQSAGAGRLKIVVAPGAQPADSAYILVTAHVSDVESPTGFSTAGTEIDRSQSACQ